MKRMYKQLLICLSISVTCASCNKYLDVQPIDRLIDDQIFSNKINIDQALNGIYLNLVKNEMYGASLTSTTLDVMAQYYYLPQPSHEFYQLSSYNYSDLNVQNMFTDIWGGSYKAILNINQFIIGLSNAKSNILSPEEKDIYLGEAYGLRAFISFDLLRTFGPVYSTDSTAISIPYPTTPQTQAAPLLAANVAMANILKDLDTAATYLKNDPIILNGVQRLSTTEDNFLRMRNTRMNYYAVNALMARVLLYRGDKRGALDKATEVISETSKWFPWSPPGRSLPGIDNPDRTFSSEVIFGMVNPNRIVVQQRYFASANDFAFTLLAPANDVLSGIYDNFTNDYRLRINWAKDELSNNRNTFTFYKYAAVADTAAWFNLQPLVRKYELYLIAAECEPDRSVALGYLNTARFNRGRPGLEPGLTIAEEIKNEYKREFWGEGQLFYYYKRMNDPSITSGSSYIQYQKMDKAQYVVPLPLNETSYR